MQQSSNNKSNQPKKQEVPQFFILDVPWEHFENRWLQLDAYDIFLFYLKISSYFQKIENIWVNIKDFYPCFDQA